MTEQVTVYPVGVSTCDVGDIMLEIKPAPRLNFENRIWLRPLGRRLDTIVADIKESIGNGLSCRLGGVELDPNTGRIWASEYLEHVAGHNLFWLMTAPPFSPGCEQ